MERDLNTHFLFECPRIPKKGRITQRHSNTGKVVPILPLLARRYQFSLFCILQFPTNIRPAQKPAQGLRRMSTNGILVLVLNDADLSILKEKSTLLLLSNKRKNVGGMHMLYSSAN